MRLLAKRCKVYISEYYMPDDFRVCLEIPVTSSLEKRSDNCKRIEKVFTYD